MFFEAVAELHPQALAILEKGADELGQVAHGDHGFIHPISLQLPEQDFQNRHISNRQQRFG
jgi:hypothetical protein